MNCGEGTVHSKHFNLFKKILEACPNQWKLSGSYSITVVGTECHNSLLVYVQKGNENFKKGVIRLNTHEMLGGNMYERILKFAH